MDMRRQLLFATALCALVSSGCQHQPTEQRGATTATAAATIVAVAPQVAPARAPAPPAPSVTKPAGLQAAVHLPPKIAAGSKVPLFVMLHGLGSSAEMIEQLSEWPKFAEDHGLAWIAPNGPLDQKGRRFWDAGPSCCNFDGAKVDHVAQLSELIERVGSNAPIDRERIFVGGYSNGGFMAHRLACERPELVRAIISVAGSGPLDRSACKKPTALEVLQIQGDADPIVTYEGGHLFKDPKLPEHVSARKTAEDWATSLGCDAKPKTLEPVDFEASIPGLETRRERYQNCKLGHVELWTVAGGAHYIGFRAPGPAAIWQFLNP
jgi:polyhydroxybutyrate depolymerase